MVRGQKSLLAVPATRRFSMMAPSPMRTPVNIRSHAASYCAILDELSNTKSRIFKVRWLHADVVTTCVVYYWPVSGLGQGFITDSL